MPLRHQGSPSGTAYSIRFDAISRPTALIGRVTPQTTKGRPTAPAPYSGFVTEYTPFDRGHIMALELNGPDIAENIVPQYRHWQETGAWRAMETTLSSHLQASGAIFAVELDYTDHPNDYTSQQARFSKNEIFDWTDPRIPDEFRIWFIIGSDPVAAKVETTLLGKIKALEKDFTDSWTAIKKKTVHTTFNHKIMPAEDVRYWQDMQIGLAVKEAYEKYLAERERDVQEMDVALTKHPVKGLSANERKQAVDVRRSPRRNDVEFTMTQLKPIKEELESTWGWLPRDTTALDGGRVMKSYLGKYSKAQEKTWNRNHEAYEKSYGGSRILRDRLRDHRSVPYPGAGTAYRGTDRF